MTKWLLAFLCLFTGVCSAQTAQPLLQPYVSFVDNSGNPCAGCSLYSYAAGTTTPQATYTTSSESIQNPNPVVLNTSGSAAIWIGSSAYKFVLLDTFGTTLWTVDNVLAPIGGSQGPFLPLSGGTLTGSLTATYFQFSANANACPSGQYVSGWSSTGWTCSAPSSGGTAGGDLSGTYPNPTVVQVEGGAIPVSAALLGTNGSSQLIAQAGTISNSTTGNAATATALAATPTQCSSGAATGIQANGDANCAASPTATFAAGTNAGGGAAVACYTGYVCTKTSGTVDLTTGTSATAGDMFTASWTAQTNAVNCTFAQFGGPTIYTLQPFIINGSTTGFEFDLEGSVASSTTYIITYGCPGP